MGTLVRKPSVLVAHEKHGDSYFHVPDDEALGRVALHILKERLKTGWLYVRPEEPKPLDFTKEDIAKLPESMREQAQKKWDQYSSEKKYVRNESIWFEDMDQAIREENGKLAWACLTERNDAEYEALELCPFVTVKDP